MTPEWSRPERLDTIGEGQRIVEISADEGERQALARRFRLAAVERLSARLAVRRTAAGILVEGRVQAAVVQACTVTGEPISSTIDEPVSLRFVEPATSEEEQELSADAIDTVDIEGGAIDLGEAAAETMALAIDPFPRGPGAAAVLRAAGVISEDDAASSGAFGGLKDMLARGRSADRTDR